MNVKKYLAMIDVDESQIEISVDFLSHLMKKHLIHVPYQNLELLRLGRNWLRFDRPVEMIENAVFKRRGGCCYDLNYSFFSLLQTLGFDCHLISAFIKQSEYDHMVIIVRLEQEYLADVGFGDFFFRRPIPLTGEVVHDLSGSYRIVRSGNRFTLQKFESDEWTVKYSFYTTVRHLEEFEDQFNWFVNFPNPFNQNIIFNICTETGFLRILNDKITVIDKGKKYRYRIPSFHKDHFENLLFFFKQIRPCSVSKVSD